MPMDRERENSADAAVHFGTRDPARLPHRMTRHDEYLHLFEQRRRIDRRLTELAESFALDPAGAPKLPKSEVRIVAVRGVTLSRGGLADV